MADLPFTQAVVTGASSGIGEAFVRRLGAAGVPTLIVARREQRLAELAAEFDVLEVLATDLTTADGQAAVVERITDPDRAVDLVVNNAGFGTSGRFHELDVDRLAAEVELNVAALTRLSHAALSTMVPRRRGWLLNVSSVASFQAAPDLAVYAATKAFVTSLTESLHEEVRGTGVRVTALCPGLTRTEFQRVSSMGGTAVTTPDIAWLSADEVAEAGLSGVIANHALEIPGVQYKAMVAASNLSPRWLTRRIAGLVQRT